MITNIDPEALGPYLEGQRIFSIIHRKDLEAAAERFQEATKKAPTFARAWGHWAYCLAQIVVAGHATETTEAKSLLEQAESYARAAVDLDRDDYANRWDLAFVLLNQGRMDEALVEYSRALDLFDNHTDKLDRRNDLLVEMAEAHVYNGDTDRAFELLDRAVRIPDWYRWIRAWACFNARDYQGAIDQINAMHKTFSKPGYVPDIQLLLAAAYAHVDQQGLADTALQNLQQGRPDWTLERELERNPFRDPADRQHWEDSMRKAGFS
jgi:tetratricopeptide (TPR) repeat protein